MILTVITIRIIRGAREKDHAIDARGGHPTSRTFIGRPVFLINASTAGAIFSTKNANMIKIPINPIPMVKLDFIDRDNLSLKIWENRKIIIGSIT
jgi:hypothetical protein